MELVVNMNDNLYKRIVDSDNADSFPIEEILVALKNGTVLPQKHGNLIDADTLDNAISIIGKCIDLDYGTISNMIEDMQPIIKGNKQNKEGDNYESRFIEKKRSC